MPEMMHTLLVGVADADAHDPALTAAVEMARRSGARLHAVHAYQLPALFTLSPGIEYIDPGAAIDYGEMVQRRFESAVHDRFPGDPVLCHARPESPAAAILRTAQEIHAELLVVGSTRHGRVGRLLLGTTAQRVVRGSEAPVLVLRGGGHPRRRVLLTTDLTPSSAAAFEQGLDLAEALAGPEGFQARALLVVWTGLAPHPLPKPAIDRAAAEELAAFCAARRPRPYTVEQKVHTGLVAEEIVLEASLWEADLVVMGTHTRSTTQRWVLGSVAEEALRDLSCSVLIVPPARQAHPAAGEAPDAEQAVRAGPEPAHA